MLEGYNDNVLCDALYLSKDTYYNRKIRGKNGNTQAKRRQDELKPIIEEIYQESNQIYGPDKISAEMHDRGYHVAPNTIAGIMHENGWFSIRGGSKALYEMNKKRKKNILKQQFTTSQPNEVWVSDVTYYTYNQRRYYICVIIDLYSRKVVLGRYQRKTARSLQGKPS